MADKVSLTAFIVARSQVIASRMPKWRDLVTDDALELSYSCIRACKTTFFLFRFYGAIPDRIASWLLDMFVVPGFVQHIVARKKHVNAAAHAAIARGAKQLVMVGAGYDALALTIAREYPDMICLEIDLPCVQATKRAALHAINDVPPNLHFVPCDFSRTALKDALAVDPLFKTGEATVFIAEALSMYLSEAENRALLLDAKAASGGKGEIIFTAIESLETDGNTIGKRLSKLILRARKEHFRWSVSAQQMREFAAACGYEVAESLTYAEIQRPYITPAEYEKLTRFRSENLYVLTPKNPLQ